MKKVTVFLNVLLFSLLLGIPINLSAQISVQDSMVLIVLYDSTDGANWIDNTNWKTSNSVDTWYGITATDSNITEINLSSNNLSGVIPDELYTLTDLVSLNIGWNFSLVGSILPAIGNLTNLTYLNLGACSLDGPIPMEIGNLLNLTSLTLYANSFSGSIPPEIGNLVNLTFLAFRNNSMSGPIPPEIGNLRNLRNLWLNQNNFDGTLPPELGNLANLTALDIGSNSFSGSIPPEFANLTSLSNLQMDDNLFNGSIPIEIFSLTNLVLLDLSFNSLTGNIPSEIDSLRGLIWLYLGSNQLSGVVPQEIGNLTNLTTLSLWGNQLSGDIPPEIGNLINLTDFVLSSNQLSGAIPDEIGNLVNLSSINLSQNQLTGSIPDTIGTMTNLSGIYLQRNQLSGTIPEAIGSLTNLQYLYLYGNQLSSSIPDTLGNLINLRQLHLYNNQLTGALPSSIANLTQLVEIYLHNNQLVDLPGLSTLNNLRWMSSENNKLTFEDIEPNIGVASDWFTYSPQDSIGISSDTLLNINDYLEMSVQVGGTANQYQWVKDGIDITNATDSIYIISSASVVDSGTYHCRITNTIATDLTLFGRPVHVDVIDPTGISETSFVLPQKYELYQNYPNPFNPSTKIKFDLPKNTKVKIKLFDVLGKTVVTLLDENLSAGNHEVNIDGSSMAGGLYFYKIETNSFSKVKKMMLIK